MTQHLNGLSNEEYTQWAIWRGRVTEILRTVAAEIEGLKEEKASKGRVFRLEAAVERLNKVCAEIDNSNQEQALSKRKILAYLVLFSSVAGSVIFGLAHMVWDFISTRLFP